MARENTNLVVYALQRLVSDTRPPLSKLLLAGSIWLLLWPARLAVLAIPLRILSRFLGEDLGVDGAIPSVDEKGLARAQHLADAFTMALRYSPESANCYPQAIVAHMILSLRGVKHALFFGLHREDPAASMEAHAWVMVDDLVVCGGHCHDKYTVVRCFVGG